MCDENAMNNSQSYRTHIASFARKSYPLPIIVFIYALSCLDVANGQAVDQSHPPPLGTLIDVGGYRVHLYCVGQGSPTVMIVGAAFSFDWGLVQPKVARFTRVCTFDPSGTAWSDQYPNPATKPSKENVAHSSQMRPTCMDRVDEIQRVISRAQIEPPYVLVGFSVGALWERLYAAKYPKNIVGMVIVDHAFLPEVHRETHIAKREQPKVSSGYTPPVLISQQPIVIGFEDDINFGRLPMHDQELHRWAMSRNPVRPDANMATDCFSRLKGIAGEEQQPLGDMPLIVISTLNDAPGYTELQTNLLTLSRHSEQIVARNSSHMVPIDRPELIVNAIQKVVTDRRRSVMSTKPPSAKH